MFKKTINTDKMKHSFSFLHFLLISLFLVQTTNAQVVPVKNGDIYTLSVGDVEFVVDASFGARITSFKLGENEMLLPGRDMTGSTLWTSPQDDWGWPPLSTTDSKKYAASIEGEKMIFVSDEDTGLKGKKFKFIKTFWASESNNSISIQYALVNTGSSSISTSLWAVTRVEPNGLTFWKTGDKKPWFSGNWTATLRDAIEEESGYYWLEFDIANGNSNKFFSGIGETGWFAHINKSNIAFIKSFDDVATSDFAPAEGEFEYYTGGTYIELENQGKYTEVAVGDTLNYDVTWHLRQISDDIPLEIGNADLIEFAQKVVDSESTTKNSDFAIPEVKIYPNPIHNFLSIEIKNNIESSTIFQLNDMSGRVILSKEFNETTQIDVSNLSNGVYFYNIISDKKSSFGKLIKR